MYLLPNHAGDASVEPAMHWRIAIWVTVLILLWLPFNAPAVGEFDGIWMGLETITAEGVSESAVGGTVIHQSSPDRLFLFSELVDRTVELHRSGSAWVLRGHLSGTLLGIPITLETMTLRFLGPNRLSFNQTLRAEGVLFTGTGDYNRQTCPGIRAPFASPPFSGAEDSLRCFELDVPAGALALRASTSGGVGDADLFAVYHKPDFRNLSSEGPDNTESVFVSAPEAGKWFVGVTGYTNFSRVSLRVEIDLPPPPAASFSATPKTGLAPLRVQFTDTSTGLITAWKWTFGDGAESAERNPIHTYASPGSFDVSLRVVGPGGENTKTEQAFIRAYDPFAFTPVLDLLLDKEAESR